MSQLTPKPLRYDFTIPSNGDYKAIWRLTDKESGDSLLEDGCLLYMSIKAVQDEGAVSVLDLELVEPPTDPPTSGFQMDVDTGAIDILIKNADIPEETVPEGQKKVKLYWDLIILYPDEVRINYAGGVITVPRGVTGDV